MSPSFHRLHSAVHYAVHVDLALCLNSDWDIRALPYPPSSTPLTSLLYGFSSAEDEDSVATQLVRVSENRELPLRRNRRPTKWWNCADFYTEPGTKLGPWSLWPFTPFAHLTCVSECVFLNALFFYLNLACSTFIICTSRSCRLCVCLSECLPFWVSACLCLSACLPVRLSSFFLELDLLFFHFIQLFAVPHFVSLSATSSFRSLSLLNPLSTYISLWQP